MDPFFRFLAHAMVPDRFDNLGCGRLNPGPVPMSFFEKNYLEQRARRHDPASQNH
jgi:hypothetical protein